MVVTEQILIRSVAGSEAGALIFDDGVLIAVVVQLDGAFYGSDHGRWFIEVTFGLSDAPYEHTFATLEDAVNRIESRARAATMR